MNECYLIRKVKAAVILDLFYIGQLLVTQNKIHHRDTQYHSPLIINTMKSRMKPCLLGAKPFE